MHNGNLDGHELTHSILSIEVSNKWENWGILGVFFKEWSFCVDGRYWQYWNNFWNAHFCGCPALVNFPIVQCALIQEKSWDKQNLEC